MYTSNQHKLPMKANERKMCAVCTPLWARECARDRPGAAARGARGVRSGPTDSLRPRAPRRAPSRAAPAGSCRAAAPPLLRAAPAAARPLRPRWRSPHRRARVRSRAAAATAAATAAGVCYVFCPTASRSPNPRVTLCTPLGDAARCAPRRPPPNASPPVSAARRSVAYYMPKTMRFSTHKILQWRHWKLTVAINTCEYYKHKMQECIK